MNFDELDDFLTDSSFADEDDENFNKENSVIVASLDWAPMPEVVSWQESQFC